MKSTKKNKKIPKTVKIKIASIFNDKRGQILNISNELFTSMMER